MHTGVGKSDSNLKMLRFCLSAASGSFAGRVSLPRYGARLLSAASDAFEATVKKHAMAVAALPDGPEKLAFYALYKQARRLSSRALVRRERPFL